jgi:ROK family
MVLVPDGRPCGCGNRGCWEQYASGRALVTEARERAAQSPTSARLLLELANGQAGSITGPMVTMGAVAGDPVALESFLDLPPSHPHRQLNRSPRSGTDVQLQGESTPASRWSAGYLSVWSSISAVGALRLTDSMPLIALALLS